MGMVTGVVAGAVVASTMSAGVVPGNAIMSPNGYDIITCRAAYSDSQKCLPNTATEPITPEQYAGNAGYRVIYRRGVLFIDKDKHIVMEVGR